MNDTDALDADTQSPDMKVGDVVRFVGWTSSDPPPRHYSVTLAPGDVGVIVKTYSEAIREVNVAFYAHPRENGHDMFVDELERADTHAD